jgi:hypothetical protein
MNSHVDPMIAGIFTTVLGVDGSEQEARLPPADPEPATCDATWLLSDGRNSETWRCVLPAGHDGLDGQHKREVVMPPPPEVRPEDKESARRYLRTRLAETQAQLCRLDGDVLGYRWYSLDAQAERSGRDEDRAAAHAAWVTMMAASHLKHGTGPGVFGRDEILAEMERLKGEGN